MTLDIERARYNMVEQQIRPWDVLDQDVLDLLYIVRREEFVPPAYRALAFSDLEIPLVPNGDPSERMLQPKLEARILQEVAPKDTDRALLIGAGSGYLAALLAARAHAVTAIEINPQLVQFARGNLHRTGVGKVEVIEGDGARGWGRGAPCDVVVVSGSLPLLPDAMLELLAPGGRLFVVLGESPVMAARLVTCVGHGSFNSLDLFETVLPPLKNAMQPARFHF